MNAHAKTEKRIWTTIVIAAGICALAFLILTQPSYLAYALGGVLCGIVLRWWLGLFIPWPGFSSVLNALLTSCVLIFVPAVVVSLAGILGIYAALIALIVMLVLGIWVFKRELKTKEFQRTLGLVMVPLGLLAFMVSISSLFLLRHSGAPRSLKAQYLGHGSINEHRWILTHVLVFDAESYAFDREAKSEQDAAQKFAQMMEQCGWKEELEGTFSFVSDQPVISQWVPFRRVNTLTFPRMSCGNMIFSTLPDSTLTLTVPKYEFAKTEPEPKSRSESLEEDEEKIIVPVQFHWNEPPSVQVQAISPLLRSRVGNLLLGGAVWMPLQWAVSVICGIFGEQIRKKWFVPSARWILTKFGVNYEGGIGEGADGKEEKRSEETSKDEDSDVIW